MMERGDHFLPREDTDASYILKEQLEKDGVKIHMHSKVDMFSLIQKGSDTEFPQIEAIISNEKGALQELRVEAVLLAVGRKPNVEGLNLDAAGVKTTPQGIEVDEYLRTANPNIYAVGDCMNDGM